MKTRSTLIITAFISWIMTLSCSQADYCTVNGTVKGLEDGAKVEMQDAWDHYKVIGTATVQDGTFAFRPNISAPTHVYLYQGQNQLKDFILEPGTIIVEVDAGDEMDCFTGAAGTISNDTYRTLQDLAANGDMDAFERLRDEVLDAEQTGPLALLFADGMCESSAQALGVLDRLAPELVGKAYVASLREELSRRIKTEPRAEGSDFIPVFIDMKYPDAEGNPVSLSSVVNNPDNRYILLDFWATWCDPCVAALPKLKEVYAKYHGKGFEIYSVSEDPNDKRWRPFLAENGMTWVNVRDDHSGRKESKAWKDYSLNGIPTMLLIDGNTGEIIARGNHLDLDTLLSSLL